MIFVGREEKHGIQPVNRPVSRKPEVQILSAVHHNERFFLTLRVQARKIGEKAAGDGFDGVNNQSPSKFR